MSGAGLAAHLASAARLAACGGLLAACGGLLAACGGLLAACGETRRPLGDECLRADDCLSSVCSGRLCVASPPVSNEPLSPPDRGARLPEGGPAGDAGGG